MTFFRTSGNSRKNFRLWMLMLLPLFLFPGSYADAGTLPTPFIFFNNTRFTNRTLLDQDGLMRSTVVYDVWGLSCSSTSCSNIPTQSAFLSTVAAYVQDSSTGSTGGYGSSYLIVLDFENIEIDQASSQAQANQEEAVLLQFAQWVRQAYPSALVGLYDYDYNTAYQSTRALLYGSSGFNVFAPSLYQRWSSHTTWQNNLNAAISHDQAINSALPIYPYISPYVSGSVSSGFLASSEWQSELSNLIASTAGGAVVWTGAATIDTTDAWYTDLLAVLSPPINPTLTYYLSNEHNALCPTLQEAVDGAAVQQTACSTQTTWQEWNFQTTPQGKFYLTSTADPAEYLSVQGGSTAAGALLEGDPAGTSGPTGSQTWHVVSAGTKYYSKGYYLLIGDASSKCIQAPASGAGAQLQDAVCSPTTTQLYTIHPITISLTSTSTLAQDADGNNQATITITNTGTATAQSVALTSYTLGSSSALGLPIAVGDIGSGESATIHVEVPASGLSSGTTVKESFAGSYTGGTFGGSARTAVP